MHAALLLKYFCGWAVLFEKKIAHVRQLRIHQYVYLCICQYSFTENRIHAKVSRCCVWKMRCAYYPLGILLLLIFQVMSSSTNRRGIMKLFSRRGRFITFIFPKPMISEFATALLSDSHRSYTIIYVVQTSHQLVSDLQRLIKVFHVHTVSWM